MVLIQYSVLEPTLFDPGAFAAGTGEAPAYAMVYDADGRAKPVAETLGLLPR
jgi:hypothetical protein